MVWYVNYDIIRGLPWERLVIIKDRRSHRVVTPSTARAYIQTSTTSVLEVTTEITGENGVQLSLTAAQTKDLPTGELAYDVFATCKLYGADVEKQVSKGLVNVSTTDRITPEEDSKALELRYIQKTDFYRTFTWKDSDAEVQTVAGAYMQAKTSAGVTVLDLRWYASKPSEATVIALSPANTRGYLIAGETAGTTLDLHISDKNDVAAGTYSYDLFVQDSSGDWDVLAAGSLVVEAATSSNPY
jgi:hypothetical protein|tara:strand:- start:3090 stop:3818 length:729 start_codon:yes stop_codon:yes gene_type:complete